MEPNHQLPWIIFDLNEQLYAISTEMVTGILQFPPITPIANAPAILLGVANIRGGVVPILDLKGLLNINDNKKETEITLTALNYKSGGIEDFLAEMRRCVRNNEHFAVSPDYFGDKINLAAFPENSQTHAFLAQVKEGQRKLEDYGDRINTKPSLLDEAVKAGKELEGLIARTIRHISDSSRRMVITLCFDPDSAQTSVGFVVDNVRSVDALTIIDNGGTGKFLYSNAQISYVAHNDKIKGEILVINDKEIVKAVDIYNDLMKKEEEKKKQLEAQKAAAEKAAAKKAEEDNSDGE